MIFTDFAPNETADDAWASFRFLFRPWLWKKGKALGRVRARLKSYFPDHSVFLFLTARTGLYHVLQSLQLEKGSHIVVQAFTCEAVILPIFEAGYTPLYIDIEPQSFSLDINDLKKKITRKTRVIILQHTYGLPPKNRDQILAYAQDKKVTVIEDLAHGFEPSFFKTETSKTIKLLSFGRSKALSSVFGGAVVTGNNKLVAKLLNVEKIIPPPSFQFIYKILLYKPLTVFIKKTYPFLIGKIIHFLTKTTGFIPDEVTTQEKRGVFDSSLNKTYPNAFAVLLLVQINKFERMCANRLKSEEIYNRTFSRKYPVFPLIRYPILSDKRAEILTRAKKKSIILGTWYDQVVAPKSIDFSKMDYEKGSCPKAEEICKKIITLPTLISEKEAKRIIKAMKN